MNSNDDLSTFSDSEIAPILSRFPGPVTLYPSKMKWLLVLLGSFVFSIGGYWMIQEGYTFWGWFDLIFFSLCVIVTPIALLPGVSALTLDADGFEFGRCRYSWRDATGFAPWDVPPSGRNKMVVFDLPVPTNPVARALVEGDKILTGHTGGALPDTYGLAAQDLAELMVRWQESAIASRSQGKT